MQPPHSPDFRPLLFIGSLWLFIGSTWGVGWAVATTVGLICAGAGGWLGRCMRNAGCPVMRRPALPPMAPINQT